MNIKDTFLKLTEFTIPYGNESDLEHFLPSGCIKDSIGNYHITIGNSDTLFTTHLDTYCRKKEKVNHIIEGNIIKTDGTTILGGDNKAGMCVLLYMISKGIPGTYYFFCGEEPILSGGTFGSKQALSSNPEKFKLFKRAIAFDRKQTGSIVTRQMARVGCSDEFTNALIKDFKECGISMKKDITGYYTDTATFLNVIPEITNISVGVWHEHNKNEYVDISYVEAIARAAVRIDWENLPTVREAKVVSTTYAAPTYKYKVGYQEKNDKKIFKKLCKLLSAMGYLCLNPSEFHSDRDMIFSKWHEEQEIVIKINYGNIHLNGQMYGYIEKLFIQTDIPILYDDIIEDISDELSKLNSNLLGAFALKTLLKSWGKTTQDFIQYSKKIGYPIRYNKEKNEYDFGAIFQ